MVYTEVYLLRYFLTPQKRAKLQENKQMNRWKEDEKTFGISLSLEKKIT